MSGAHMKKTSRCAAAFLAGLAIFLVAASPSGQQPQDPLHFNYLGVQQRLVNTFYGQVAPSCRTGAELSAAWAKNIDEPLRTLDSSRLPTVKSIFNAAKAVLKWTSGRSPEDPGSGFRPGGDYDTTCGSMAEYYRTIKYLDQNSIPYHESPNSITVPGMNWTNHMPDPPFPESLTERSWTRDAMALDPEAASHYGLAGREVGVPVYESTTGRMLVVNNPLPNNAFTPLGDLAKKNQEALAMISKADATMADVHEAINFASKAQGKAFEAMRQCNLAKDLKPVERMSNVQIAERLRGCGDNVEMGQAIAREYISQTGGVLSQYGDIAGRDISQRLVELYRLANEAQARGDAMAAARFRTQITEINASVRETNLRLRNDGICGGAGGQPSPPRTSTLQNVLDKGMQALQLALALRAVYAGTVRELEDAEREGRDVSAALVVIKSLDEFLGVSRAWETGRMAGEQTMAKYIEQAMREGRDLTLLETLKAKMESLLVAFGEFSNINAFGCALDEARKLIEADIAEVDARLREHREWLRMQEMRERRPAGTGVPSLVEASKAKRSKVEAKVPEAEMDRSSKWSTVSVSEVSVFPGIVDPGDTVKITARVAGERMRGMTDMSLSCLVDGDVVDLRSDRGQPGGFNIPYHVSYEVPDDAAPKIYRVQVVAEFEVPLEVSEEEARKSAAASGETTFEVTEGPQVAWARRLTGSLTIEHVHPRRSDIQVDFTPKVCNKLQISIFPYGLPLDSLTRTSSDSLPFSGKASYNFVFVCLGSQEELAWKESFRNKTIGELWTNDIQLVFSSPFTNPEEFPWTGTQVSGKVKVDIQQRRRTDYYGTFAVFSGAIMPDMSSGQGTIAFFHETSGEGGQPEFRKAFEGRWSVRLDKTEYVGGETAEALLKKFGRK